MNLINQFQYIIILALNLIFSINFIILFISIIIFYHLILLIFRDNKYKNLYKSFEESKDISLDNLIDIPLVNIIIPAWKEGEILRGCLFSITKLEYPRLQVIINAGGSEETVNIANSFKADCKFNIIYQKAGEGKVKAINDCLNHITEGIIYLIDADMYLTDKIFLSTIYEVINKHKEIVVARDKPHESIKNKDLVKYICINRNFKFNRRPTRETNFITQNTAIKYDVIKKIGKFKEKQLIDDGISMGFDLISKGYKIYYLIESRVESFNYPQNIISYITQNLRWIENDLSRKHKNRKFKILKFIGLVGISFYILITPLFLIINIYLFFLGIILFLNMYLKKIRKILFFNLTAENNSITFKPYFFLKLNIFILIDLIMNIIALFELIFYKKAYKKRKNLI